MGPMTRRDRIRAAIWTPAAITVALTAMYWDGTDTMTWVGEVLVGLGLLISGALGFIYDRRKIKIMPRNALKQARLDAGMTQQQVADVLGISLRYYQNIEQGSRTGDFELWDRLEDLFNAHQRVLRENYPGKEDNR